MLKALIAGEREAEKLAALAQGFLRKKEAQRREALVGRVTDHHAVLLQGLLSHIECLAQQIALFDAHIQGPDASLRRGLGAARPIPGVAQRSAEQILAELGNDMSRFPTAAHAASWTGICPENTETAGKRKSGRTRQGHPLVARHAGHSIVVTYRTLGPAYFDRLDRDRLVRFHTRRLAEPWRRPVASIPGVGSLLTGCFRRDLLSAGARKHSRPPVPAEKSNAPAHHRGVSGDTVLYARNLAQSGVVSLLPPTQPSRAGHSEKASPEEDQRRRLGHRRRPAPSEVRDVRDVPL
jgi:Transposase IS116/IS110/IS902 family